MDAPAVAVSADGKTMAVAWMDMRRGGQERDVFWRLITGGRPGNELPLPDDSRDLQGHPALAMDEAGVVHAVWEDNRSVPLRIYSARSDRKGNLPLSDAKEGRASFPGIASNGKRVAVVYEAGDGGSVICRVVAR